MNSINALAKIGACLCALLAIAPSAACCADSAKAAAETKIEGPDGLHIVVRMQGPYDADVPLQIVCYFKRTADSDTRMTGGAGRT